MSRKLPKSTSDDSHLADDNRLQAAVTAGTATAAAGAAATAVDGDKPACNCGHHLAVCGACGLGWLQRNLAGATQEDDQAWRQAARTAAACAGSYSYAPPVQEGGRMTGDTSVDAHHAGYAFTDTTLALMSYNIGIQNAEIHTGKQEWQLK